MVNKKVIFEIEFDQFISKIKTDVDLTNPDILDDQLFIVLLVSFSARILFICDDSQFYPIKSYLLDLFSSEFKNGEELYQMGVSQNILNLIYKTLNDKERKATINLFGKGDFFPFDKAPVLIFGKEAFEENDKFFSKYTFIQKIKNNEVFYKLKMPFFNPTKVFVPLALSFVIQYVFLNIKEANSFNKAKNVVLELLKSINNKSFNEHRVANNILMRNSIF